MDSWLTSPLAFALIWPVIFAILEVLFNKLSEKETRSAQRKFSISYVVKNATQNDGLRYESPLTLFEVYEILHKRKATIADVDVDVLPAGFWETSLSVDLCIAAMSTSIVNLIALINKVSQTEDATPLLISGILVLTGQFIALGLVTVFLRRWKDKEDKPRARLLIIQFTNLIGLVAMSLSFFTIGRILIQ